MLPQPITRTKERGTDAAALSKHSVLRPTCCTALLRGATVLHSQDAQQRPAQEAPTCVKRTEALYSSTVQCTTTAWVANLPLGTDSADSAIGSLIAAENILYSNINLALVGKPEGLRLPCLKLVGSARELVHALTQLGAQPDTA
jgi:hypothetical protein